MICYPGPDFNIAKFVMMVIVTYTGCTLACFHMYLVIFALLL